MTIVVPITDIPQYKGYPQQVMVPGGELGHNGKDSVIECGHLRTIDRDLRIDAGQGVIAHVSDKTLGKVDAALRSSLSL